MALYKWMSSEAAGITYNMPGGKTVTQTMQPEPVFKVREVTLLRPAGWCGILMAFVPLAVLGIPREPPRRSENVSDRRM